MIYQLPHVNVDQLLYSLHSSPVRCIPGNHGDMSVGSVQCSAIFGRFERQMLQELEAAMKGNHCFINGLVLVRFVLCFAGLLYNVKDGAHVMQNIMAFGSTGRIQRVVISMHILWFQFTYLHFSFSKFITKCATLLM